MPYKNYEKQLANTRRNYWLHRKEKLEYSSNYHKVHRKEHNEANRRYRRKYRTWRTFNCLVCGRFSSKHAHKYCRDCAFIIETIQDLSNSAIRQSRYRRNHPEKIRESNKKYRERRLISITA